MEKYYIVGYTVEEIALGYELRFMNVCSEVFSKNMTEAQELAIAHIPFREYPIIAYSLPHSRTSEIFMQKHELAEYYQYDFINETLKNALEEYGYSYNYIGEITEEELPDTKVLLVKLAFYKRNL